MRRFLYFLPNAVGCPDLQRLRAAGLGYAFDNQGAQVETSNGPSNEPGILKAMGGGENLAFNPHEQLWQRMTCGAWVGMARAKENQPGPADLRRETEVSDFHQVLLGDGKEWMIPILRFANGDTRFPQVMKIDDAGKAFYETRDEYRDIFALATEMVHASLSGQGAKFSADDHMRLASEALRIGYRVGPYEIAMLKLIDSQNLKLVANAALDGPNLVKLAEEFKKKLAAESSRGPILETGARV